jgi:hypothetical protein
MIQRERVQRGRSFTKLPRRRGSSFCEDLEGFIDKHWSHETFSNSATFGLGSEADKGKHHVDALQDGGLEKLNVQIDESVFVIGCDNSAMPTGIDG